MSHQGRWRGKRRPSFNLGALEPCAPSTLGPGPLAPAFWPLGPPGLGWRFGSWRGRFGSFALVLVVAFVLVPCVAFVLVPCVAFVFLGVLILSLVAMLAQGSLQQLSLEDPLAFLTQVLVVV